MAQNQNERRLLAGIRAARQGNNERARELLEGVLRLDRTNEQAWIFLASVVTSERERRMSLERIVRINPNNRPAQQALNDMVGVLGGGAGELDVEAMSQAARTPIPSGSGSSGGNRGGNARPVVQNQGGSNNLFAILAVVAVVLGIAFLGLIFAPQFLGNDVEPTVVAEAETTEEPTNTPDPNFTPDTATPIPTSTFSGVFVTVERDATLPATFTPEPSLTPSVTPTATPTLPPRENYSFLLLGVQGVAQPAIYRLNGDGAGLLPIVSDVAEFDFNPETGVIVYTEEDSITRPTETPTPTPVITDTPSPTPTLSPFATQRPANNNTTNNNDAGTGGGGIILNVTSSEIVVSRMFITNTTISVSR
ncbi:MAG: tetratricopeptide repeat protein [Chloroflexota bacterium]